MATGRKRLFENPGPTASGKTARAIGLSRERGGIPIVSADSRQVYREMRIGTARPTDDELAMAPHVLVGHRSVLDEPYSAGAFVADALAFLEAHYREADEAILCGGTGMYIRALCEGIDSFPDVDEATREQVRALYAEQGIEALRAALAVEDAAYFSEVDRDNPHRLIRALEVTRSAGRPFSSFRSGGQQARFFAPEYELVTWPRPDLNERIDRRVDAMMAEGLLAEAEVLYPFRHLTPLQTVGYQELFDYFDGRWSLDEAVERIKIHTRQYAKRQTTWFMKYLPEGSR